MATGATWRGLPQFNAKIARMPTEVRGEVKRAIDRSARRLGRRIKASAPVHPEAPHIRDTVEIKPGRSELSVDISVGNDTNDYAAALEFGHMKGSTHVPKQPFFFTSVAVERKSHRRAMLSAFRKAMRKVWGAAQ